jgi:hypothetical protein
MSSKMAPPKSKNRRKKKPRVRIPDFEKVEDEYSTLFLAMGTELSCHELHSNFDYLSFFRRASKIVLRIRNEVLHDNTLQLARRSDMQKAQKPDNFTLIGELFSSLQMKPKDRSYTVAGGEVSTDVVPLDQLKRIAGIIDEVVRTEGSVELDRARMRLHQDWDGLKAAYAAEEGKDLAASSPPGVPLAAGASIHPPQLQTTDPVPASDPTTWRLHQAYIEDEDEAEEQPDKASYDPIASPLPPDVLMSLNVPIPNPSDNQTAKTTIQKPHP